MLYYPTDYQMAEGLSQHGPGRFVSGLDSNDMFFNHFSCMDAGAKCGWGRVVMKAEGVEEAGLEDFPKRGFEKA